MTRKLSLAGRLRVAPPGARSPVEIEGSGRDVRVRVPSTSAAIALDRTVPLEPSTLERLGAVLAHAGIVVDVTVGPFSFVRLGEPGRPVHLRLPGRIALLLRAPIRATVGRATTGRATMGRVSDV